MLGPAAPGGPGGVRAPLSRSLGRLECLCSRCFAIDGPIAHDGPRPRYLLWLDGGPSGRCLPGLGRAMSGLGLRMLTDETADGRNSRLASKAFDFQDAHTLTLSAVATWLACGGALAARKEGGGGGGLTSPRWARVCSARPRWPPGRRPWPPAGGPTRAATRGLGVGSKSIFALGKTP